MSSFRHPNSTPARSNDFTMKAPKPPDRPLVPYMRYSRKMWSKVRAENPDAQLWDIGKIIGQMWRDTTDPDKAIFQQEYEIEKVEYEKAMKVYHSSPGYQQYISAKNRAKANEKSSRSRVEAGGVVIQPVDEDEYNNELTSRRLAAVRFDRNHRLIADLFSPSIVTDTRTIVAQSRMDMLRRQAQSLSAHQAKLEEELTKLEADHLEKKKQIEKNSEEFTANLAKVCEEKPQLDEDKYNELLEEWKGKLVEAYGDYKKKQDEMNEKQVKQTGKDQEDTPVLAELVRGEARQEAGADSAAKEEGAEKASEEEKETPMETTDGEEPKKE